MATEFVFVVPVYNCQDTIQQTLLSIVAQSYHRWRIILIDDMSTDQTFERASMLIDSLGINSQTRVVVTTKKCGEVVNTLNACKEIESHEVICRLDGGDWLTDNDLLIYLDAVFSQENPAVAWTAHRWGFSSYNISKDLPNGGDCDVYNDLRGEKWCVSHLKCARRSAFDGINDANYRDESGDYINIACDRTIFLPLLHKAYLEKQKRLFVPIVAYHYSIPLEDPNLFTNERSIRQRKSADFIHDRGFIV